MVLCPHLDETGVTTVSKQRGLLTEGPSNIPVLPCATASFPVVLGDFGCDITCQACREVRLGHLANNGKSKMAAPSQECDFSQNS